ncbi:MAG: thioredoxin domain-containing protein [Myxococcales bacterium]|nr:thioredoxin domain-containing protein [Myxococcales bacterium]
MRSAAPRLVVARRRRPPLALGLVLVPALLAFACGPDRARTEALEQRVAWLEQQLGPVVEDVYPEGQVTSDADAAEQPPPQAPAPQGELGELGELAAPTPTPIYGGDLSSRVDALIDVAEQTKGKVTALEERVTGMEGKLNTILEKLEAMERDAEKPPDRPGRPDPAARYRVAVDESYSKGPADAKVTLVIFSDFQCPFCQRVETTLAEVERRYKADVRLVFRHNPLAFHKDALPAAKAAEAAGRQGKFWEMHDLLFANNRELTQANFERWAQQLGLDVSRFKRDMDDGKLAAGIERDQKDATQVGARGTPAFFINGRFLSGAQPFASFEKLIDEELKEAERLIAAGTARARVYETLMKDAKPGV